MISWKQYIKKEKKTVKQRMALEMRKPPKLKKTIYRKSLIGARFKNPNFKKGDLVEYNDAEHPGPTAFRSDVGVVLGKERHPGLIRFTYLVYWQRANVRKKISEPDLRRARSKNDNRECDG